MVDIMYSITIPHKNSVDLFEKSKWKKGDISDIILNIGDWSNGMIGVSKTFGGSSILSSPARNL